MSFSDEFMSDSLVGADGQGGFETEDDGFEYHFPRSSGKIPNLKNSVALFIAESIK